MGTWVLVITLLINGAPVGVTSVSGYPDQASCSAAGRELADIERLRASHYDSSAICIHGPAKE
jgi:hypothetical protein